MTDPTTGTLLPARLHGHGWLDWPDATGHLGGATCAWADYRGFHVETCPQQLPHTSHLWAWRGETVWRLRIDNGRALVTQLSLLPTDTVGGVDTVTVRRLPGLALGVRDDRPATRRRRGTRLRTVRGTRGSGHRQRCGAVRRQGAALMDTDTTRLVNLTPHTVVVDRPDGTRLVLPAANPDRPAHSTEQARPAGSIDGVPLVRLRYGQVTDLPDARPGVRYIVSLPVMLARRDRGDLLVPAEQTRHGERACRAFAVSVE